MSIGVGKTSLLIRFHENEFVVHQKTTIGVDYKAKEVKIDGESVKLQIWDTAGLITFLLKSSTHCSQVKSALDQ
jgi:Ras-related protein Rab-1A